MDRDAFLAGLDPSLVGEEKRAGLIYAARFGLELAGKMLENGAKKESAGMYILADILNHLGSGADANRQAHPVVSEQRL
jgi:hypothetical protein